MSANVAVVIPIYKEEINELEKISLAQVRKVLGRYPIIFVAPQDKKISYLEPGDMLVQFHPQYFQSRETYSQLLLSPFFYEPFLIFDYILIYQLDAFVFYDALEDFCSLGYDYIGAPWPYPSWNASSYRTVKIKKTPRVGNGGFSLRKVKACHKLLTKCSSDWDKLPQKFIEDTFFALCGAASEVDFHTAPVKVAKAFSMEWYPERCVKKLGGNLPFGCHNWHNFNADFYVEVFSQLGYDLRPLRSQMANQDYEANMMSLTLIKLAFERLLRRIKRGESLLEYLPKKFFASVRVIRSPESMKILAGLLREKNFLADKIFIYDEENFRDLIRDTTREELPHLVLTTDYDKSLIAAIENKELVYGEHVISFRQEFIKSQEKIFHSLGKGVYNNGN